MTRSNSKQTRKIPAKTMPVWKYLGLFLILFGSFGAFMTFFPQYSQIAGVIAIILALLGVSASLIARTGDLWGRYLTAMIWPCYMLGIGTRALGDALGDEILILGAILPFFIIASVLPILLPRLSEWIWRESTAPETKAGQSCLFLSLRIAPIVGSVSALIGIFARRGGYAFGLTIIIGVIFFLSAIGLAQLISHQIWQERSQS